VLAEMHDLRAWDMILSMFCPLVFEPRLLPKMWGGRKLQTVLGKSLPPGQAIGEAWELYDFPPGALGDTSQWVSSTVVGGPWAGRSLHSLVAEFGRDLCGDLPLLGPEGQFPILLKFLDASQDLSVQVHPDEVYAAAHPGAHLKTEAWYIVQADPGARLLKDLKPGVTREAFAQAITVGTCEQLIESVPAREGMCFFLPSGTVHALGAGILAAEVQTPSDTTFRVYDFNRIDPSTGRPRTLHVAQALECIRFGEPPLPPPRRSHVAGPFTTVTRLVSCPHFTVEKVRFAGGIEQAVPYDQPVVWMMLEGAVEIAVEGAPEGGRLTQARKAQTMLLPAGMKNPVLRTLTDAVWLEITFPLSTHGAPG
jgi:mannose-6-phosphate isomerase